MIKEFKGECFGIRLTERGNGYVQFDIIVEDDGQWFVTKSGGGSSFWLYDLQSELNNAIKWCEDNCAKGEWGFMFEKRSPFSKAESGGL